MKTITTNWGMSRIDSTTGLLTKVPTVPVIDTGYSAGSNLTPDCKFIYEVSSPNFNVAKAYSRCSTTGILTHVGKDYATRRLGSPSSVVVDSQRECVGVSDFFDHTISGYHINP